MGMARNTVMATIAKTVVAVTMAVAMATAMPATGTDIRVAPTGCRQHQ